MTLDEFLSLPTPQRRAAELTTAERVRLMRELRERGQKKTRHRAGNINQRSACCAIRASHVVSLEEWRKWRNK